MRLKIALAVPDRLFIAETPAPQKGHFVMTHYTVPTLTVFIDHLNQLFGSLLVVPGATKLYMAKRLAHDTVNDPIPRGSG